MMPPLPLALLRQRVAVPFAQWLEDNMQPLQTLWENVRAANCNVFDACDFEQFARAMYNLSSKTRHRGHAPSL